MAKNIHSSTNNRSRRTGRKNLNSKRKKSFFKRIIRIVKKDPIKIFSVVFGGLLLIIITMLFILYSRDSSVSKKQLQRIESR